MVIKPLEQKKRQQTLLIIGAGILVIAVLVLYFGFWKKEGVIEEEPLEVEQEIDMSKNLDKELKKIDLDFDFLNQTILPFLKIHGDIPVEKGETGRTNPFIPY